MGIVLICSLRFLNRGSPRFFYQNFSGKESYFLAWTEDELVPHVQAEKGRLGPLLRNRAVSLAQRKILNISDCSSRPDTAPAGQGVSLFSKMVHRKMMKHGRASAESNVRRMGFRKSSPHHNWTAQFLSAPAGEFSRCWFARRRSVFSSRSAASSQE